jgi:Mitochondrial carrier protein
MGNSPSGGMQNVETGQSMTTPSRDPTATTTVAQPMKHAFATSHASTTADAASHAAAPQPPSLAFAVGNGNSGSFDSLVVSTIRHQTAQWPREGRNLLAGGVAGIVAKSVVAPLDRIKILYQVSSARFRFWDLPKVMSNIVRDEGVSALWKGNMATMIRVFPYSGIQFMVFDFCKNYFIHAKAEAHRNIHQEPVDIPIHTVTTAPENVANRHDRKWGLTPLESLLAGMVAGTVSVICTYPLDLARAQLAVLKKTSTSNQGFVGVLKENYGRGGLAGLFRGISPTLLGILPYSGIAFALNEQGKQEVRCCARR